MPLRLTTLGQLFLADADTGRRLAVQRKALVLLAVLAAERRPVPRERLMLLLWPEGGESARGALKQTVYQLRRSVGADDVVVGTTDLSFNDGLIAADVIVLERAYGARDWERVANEYGGPFLDGVTLRASVDFEHWADARRQHFVALFQHALEESATSAGARGDARAAVSAWRRLAAADPLSSRSALGLITALTQAGEYPAALAHYATYEGAVRSELGVDPDPSVTVAIDRIRTAGAGVTHFSPLPESVAPLPLTLAGAAPARAGARARPLWMMAGVVAAALVLAAFAWRSRSSIRELASVELPERASARIAIDHVFNRLYVDGGASFEHALALIDAASLRTRTVQHGAGTFVDPITHWYWTGDFGGRFVLARNGFTDSILTQIAVPGCPHAFANNDGWVWVAQQCDDHISVIDNRTRRVVRHIPIPTLSRREVGGAKGMGEIVINPVTGMVYFWKDMMPHRIDPRTWTITETPQFGGHVIAVNTTTNHLYVGVFHGLRVVDGNSEQTVAEIRLPAPPWSVTVGVAGARVYAAMPDGLVILDGRTHGVIETITFDNGFRPHGVAVDETRRRAYLVGTESTGRRTLRVFALAD